MINSIDFLGIIVMTLCGAFGGLYLKKSVSLKGTINIFLIIGLAFYGAGAVLNIILLRFVSLTIIFPCNALTYVWTTIMAKLVFKENINKYKIIGLMLILLGLLLIVI